jgi:CBS domain-containing protein
MKVQDLMTKNPACSTPDMDLTKVAKMMAEHNVGAIPVVDNKDSKKVVGIITDRDITVRCVAEERMPSQMTVGEVMSSPIVTVQQDASVDEVTRLMENNMVRRVPVVDAQGNVCGIVAQADIALRTSDRTVGDTVEKISRPTQKSSNVR